MNCHDGKSAQVAILILPVCLEMKKPGAPPNRSSRSDSGDVVPVGNRNTSRRPVRGHPTSRTPSRAGPFDETSVRPQGCSLLPRKRVYSAEALASCFSEFHHPQEVNYPHKSNLEDHERQIGIGRGDCIFHAVVNGVKQDRDKPPTSTSICGNSHHQHQPEQIAGGGFRRRATWRCRRIPARSRPGPTPALRRRRRATCR
jgi:hypothetical protein